MPAESVADSPDVLFEQLAHTVLQQSTLCPLPLVVQPVHWAHDHALQLYPLPHAVVLADASPQAHCTHAGCTVINPVSCQLAAWLLLAAWLPLLVAWLLLVDWLHCAWCDLLADWGLYCCAWH